MFDNPTNDSDALWALKCKQGELIEKMNVSQAKLNSLIINYRRIAAFHKPGCTDLIGLRDSIDTAYLTYMADLEAMLTAGRETYKEMGELFCSVDCGHDNMVKDQKLTPILQLRNTGVLDC